MGWSRRRTDFPSGIIRLDTPIVLKRPIWRHFSRVSQDIHERVSLPPWCPVQYQAPLNGWSISQICRPEAFDKTFSAQSSLCLCHISTINSSFFLTTPSRMHYFKAHEETSEWQREACDELTDLFVILTHPRDVNLTAYFVYNILLGHLIDLFIEQSNALTPRKGFQTPPRSYLTGTSFFKKGMMRHERSCWILFLND